MIQKVSILAITFGVCMAVEIAAGGAGQPVPQISPRPALFTEAQAASGEALYRQSCAACHGATLTGGTAPALTGPAFEASWGNPRVDARRPLLHRADHHAAAGVELVVAAGSRRGVRLHPEVERVSVRRDRC